MTRKQFSATYQSSVREVAARMPADWTELARHNAGWRKDRFDADAYLVTSEERYWRALGILSRIEGRRILDVGGFLGAFPLTLTRLGYRVTIAERYGYYGDAMRPIADHLAANGIEVLDADFSEPLPAGLQAPDPFDGVTCMAVAEHLAHSPRALMENLHRALRPGGTLVFEVPNLAYWPKRYAFFVRGSTVHAPIDEVYHSAIPFTGHHREYTFEDARYVAREGGFEIVAEHAFNYTVDPSRPLALLKYLPAFVFREWAEVIMLDCRRPAGPAQPRAGEPESRLVDG